MLAPTSRFKINEPHVIGEILEGELVLVHFESGCYYSIRGTGADIWNLAIAGHSPDGIAEALAAHHRLNAADVATSVNSFVMQLVAEQLLVPTGDSALPADTSAPLSKTYDPPVVEKYSDLAGHLLLDPIHEVGHEIDPSGWPAQKAA
jgi:hypothetical protein